MQYKKTEFEWLTKFKHGSSSGLILEFPGDEVYVTFKDLDPATQGPFCNTDEARAWLEGYHVLLTP